MTWPGWGEVLPLVVGAVTLFAVLVGGMRALTRTVAEQASAAAMDAAKKSYRLPVRAPLAWPRHRP